MGNIEYRLERPLWMLILIPVAILLFVIFFTMKKETRRKGKTIASLIIHGVVAVILAILAAGFSIATETTRQSTVILMDVSESTIAVREDITATCEAILGEFPERDVKGVVLFGQDSVFIGRRDAAGLLSLKKADASGTDITTALYEARELMDKYTHKRIILLSDGKETSGDALYAARRLAEEGVRIDAMYFDTNGQADSEVQISAMSSLGGSYIGDTIRLSLTLRSNLSGEGTIALYEGETLLEERPVTLSSGEQTLHFEQTAETAGIHSYRAVLTCEGDTETRNNEAYTVLHTNGNASILIIAEDPSAAEELKRILSDECDVTVVSQSNAPSDLPTLCNYDGYYLMNVDVNNLPTNLGEALDIAVRVFGKSLCFVGGDATFRNGHMGETVYHQMLPLDFGSRDSSGVALMIVMDVSMSMVGGKTNYLELAKVGAIRSLDNLQANDYVGVIVFSGNARVIVYPMKMTAENKETVANAIAEIQATSGTIYTPALQEARNLLKYYIKDDVPDSKHILFLSDGEPLEGAKEIYDMVERMYANDGITVTAIGMNSMPSELYILRNMAKKGGGTFTYVKNAMDLPSIMIDQSKELLAQYAFEEPFVPQIEIKDDITEGLSTLPQINGYVGMHAKEEAHVYLTSERGDPIYAKWQYGEGTVACFTTDLTGGWSGDFLNSDAGKDFILKARKAIDPDTRYDSAIMPTVTVDGNRVTVMAELSEEGDDFELMAEITGPEQQKLPLDRISSSGYEGSTVLSKTGEYKVKITWKKRSHTVDETTVVFAVSYSGEYDLFREGDPTLLSEIAASTGGALDMDPYELARQELGVIRSVTTFELPLCIIASILLLVDIILRRLTWADVRKWLARKGKAG